MNEHQKNTSAKLRLHPIGSLFSKTWHIYKERFGVFIEIILLPVLVMILGYILLGLGSPFSILGMIVVVLGLITFIFGVLAIIFSLRNTTGVDESYKAAIGSFWPFAWLLVLDAIMAMGAFFMLIIPGVWLSVAVSLATYVFVVEHRRGIDALRQSKDYIKGYWWAFLGRTLLLSIIFVGISVVIQVPVGIIFGSGVAAIASMIATLFMVPFSAIYSYTIYENFRELKPELAAVHTKEGTGFIKASTIVGLVGVAALFILLIVAVCAGAFRPSGDHGYYPPVSGYGAQNSW